jgi:molybdopterin molybdotransferase
MITVEQALTNVFDLVSALDTETIPLTDAGGRILAQTAVATRDQPPFASSAMDGYAVQSHDLKTGATLNVIGTSAAGARFDGAVTAGNAVRIFTGAPVPEGADRILIQEDCERSDEVITIGDNLDSSKYIRPAGGDFKVGDEMSAPRQLGPSDVALLAAMNIPNVTVYRKPIIALIATGDELVTVGDTPDMDQIISSNNYGLKVMIEAAGGIARILPIARDTRAELECVLGMCTDVDMIVTLGGASVGDYDLVHSVAGEMGMETAFYKVAMRPGKPLMAGRLRGTPMIGLPGNPVSSMVCGTVFLIPAIKAMLGLPKSPMPSQNATLAIDIGKNGPRAHYMRAVTTVDNGTLTVRPFDRQDSSLLSVLSDANALMVRQPNDPAQNAGTSVQIIPL